VAEVATIILAVNNESKARDPQVVLGQASGFQVPVPLLAVIFDMDGVLFDTEQLARELWRDVFADYGIKPPDELYRQAIGRSIAGTMQLFDEAFGDCIDIQELDEKQEALYRKCISQTLPIKPGVFELLDWLRVRQVPTAVASSTYHAEVEGMLTRNGLRAYFSAVIGGDEVAVSKPAPDIFLKAADELGVDPAYCLAIEDSNNGLRAAQAAGMSTVMVPDLIAPAEVDADLSYQVCASLVDLREELEQVGSGSATTDSCCGDRRR
jgi:HAD superfamily hydrolase (TIGR01509 family)